MTHRVGNGHQRKLAILVIVLLATTILGLW
jgi:hypothetical protein